MRSRKAFLLPLLLSACAGGGAAPTAADLLHARGWGADGRGAVTSLVFVLHDDLPGSADAAAGFAETLGQGAAGVRAVALLRPGHGDAFGNRSPGILEAGHGDGYSPERLDAVARTIADTRQRFPAAQVLLVGEGGGAAIAAGIAGTRPALIDGLVLAGCPCMLPEWRSYMARQQPAAAAAAWTAKVASFDPLMTVGGVSPSIKAALLVGADDRIAPPRFSRAYAEALALRGIATDYRVLPGRGHGILGDAETLAATRRVLFGIGRRS